MRSHALALSIAIVVTLSLCACSSATGTGSGAATTSTPSAGSTTTPTATAEAMRNSNPDPNSLLSVSDVEHATGLTGMRLVAAGSTPDAVGRLNFATSDGTLVAIMNIGDAVAFDQSMQGMYFSKVTTGTGDMCFVGPSPKISPTLSLFAAAKGDHAIIMKTFLEQKGGTATWLSIAQLQALTGLALQRWGG